MATRPVLLLVALLLVATWGASPASACCHVFEIEQKAGPCVARWEGDLFDGARTDRVSVVCVVGDHGAGIVLTP